MERPHLDYSEIFEEDVGQIPGNQFTVEEKLKYITENRKKNTCIKNVLCLKAYVDLDFKACSSVTSTYEKSQTTWYCDHKQKQFILAYYM